MKSIGGWTRTRLSPRLRQVIALSILSALLVAHLEIMFYKVLKFTHRAGFWRVTGFQLTWLLIQVLMTFTIIRPISE